jgi:ornithine carbamoyltransferase
LLKEHDKMVVNNLICETLHPENLVAKLYEILEPFNEEEQYKLIEKFNEYAGKSKYYSSSKK